MARTTCFMLMLMSSCLIRCFVAVMLRHWHAFLEAHDRRFAVYAVGLYLDGNGARQALRKFRGQSAAKLAGSQAFFNGVQWCHLRLFRL